MVLIPHDLDESLDSGSSRLREETIHRRPLVLQKGNKGTGISVIDERRKYDNNEVTKQNKTKRKI